MVDPQTLQLALGDKRRHQAVNGIEHLGALDPDARELVYVEKAAVIDLVRGHLPERQPISLALEQAVEWQKRVRLSRLAIERRRGTHERLRGLGRCARELRQIALESLRALALPSPAATAPTQRLEGFRQSGQ